MVLGTLKVGGLERVAVNCVKYCASQEIKFDFLIFDPNMGELEREVEKIGCSVIRLKHSKNPVTFYNSLCKVIIQNGPYDIIHSHIFFNSGIVMLAAKRCCVKCRISHSHSIERHGDSKIKKYTYQILMRMLINKYSTKICACSYAAGEYVFGKKKFDLNGIIIPNIIEPQRYAYSSEERKRIRDEFGISDSMIVMGMIGHLTSIKNPQYILQIVSELNKEIDTVAIVVGDGPLLRELKNQADYLHIVDKVIFTGVRDDIGAILSAMDLYVCSSLSEGFGIVLLESLANGLPYVAEKHALVKEIVALGHVELVDGFNDIENWIRAIKTSIAEGRVYKAYASLLDSNFMPTFLEQSLKNLYM